MQLITLVAAAALAPAAPQVVLTSHIAVERSVPGTAGKPVITYQEPRQVTPGDRLGFTLDYANRSARAAQNFVVTNPVPQGVAFVGDASPGALVSVDGGKSFGELAELKVRNAGDSLRRAVAADVTHIRWTFERPIAPGEHGELRFEAVVK